MNKTPMFAVSKDKQWSPYEEYKQNNFQNLQEKQII
ncbi:hypothetical protein Bache_1920 [Bacteroides helcogenes P 36-108]|uniref:Uncharacterized protein n=1 Tax=Bacteroides helcogenes (strain ATCC 35417 / DSM 20613 / JCM 6297 / CCUG 15421 / P 36-108) TaxID=693979 RepID=E6SPQ7_BACT6|nr:hypothetical protein Bache_1920 [Bacteroides helcogenes P 36-108]